MASLPGSTLLRRERGACSLRPGRAHAANSAAHSRPKAWTVTYHKREKRPVLDSAALLLCPVLDDGPWSGWPDLNRRPLDPQSSALPGCATPRIVRPQREPRSTTEHITCFPGGSALAVPCR